MKLPGFVVTITVGVSCFGTPRIPLPNESQDFCGRDQRCQIVYESSYYLDDLALDLAKSWIQWPAGRKGDYVVAIKNKKYSQQEIADCSDINIDSVGCMSKRGKVHVVIGDLVEWGSPEGDLVFIWANLKRARNYVDDAFILGEFERLVVNHTEKNRPLVAKTIKNAMNEMRERKFDSAKTAFANLENSAIRFMDNRKTIEDQFIKGGYMIIGGNPNRVAP